MLVLGVFCYGGRNLRRAAWNYPRALLILLAVFTAIMLIQAIVARSKELKTANQENIEAADPQQITDQKVLFRLTVTTIVVCCVIMIAYIFSITILGYLSASVLFVAGTLYYLRIRKWWIVLAVSIGTPAFLYYMFNNLLMVLLPSGVLF